MLELVRHLGFLQLDPIAAVAPSADLVVWSRLGSSYDPAELRNALVDRTLIELQASIRPAEDLALYRADMAVWPGSGDVRPWQVERRAWVKANDACRRDILRRLKFRGRSRCAICPTRARCPGHRPGGPTTATWRRCSTSWWRGARSRSPAGKERSVSGSWRGGLPRRPGRPRRGCGPHPQRAAPQRVRHRTGSRDAGPGGAMGCGRGG